MENRGREPGVLIKAHGNLFLDSAGKRQYYAPAILLVMALS